MWNYTKVLWNHGCFHILNQEIYKISEIYNKTHEKIYKKDKIFQIWYIKSKNQLNDIHIHEKNIRKSYVKLLEMLHTFTCTL